MTIHKNLPYWRIDNIVPLLGLVVALVINVGAIFWWGGRTDIQLQQVIANQVEIKDNWIKVETRLGRDEIDIAQLQTAITKR